MGDGVVGMAGAVEVLPQLEVGRRLGLLPPTATRTGDDLVGRQREAAVGSFVRPVTQGSDVPLGLDADLVGLLEHVDDVLRRPLGRLPPRARSLRPRRRGGLGRAHDHTLLVDPHPVGDIEDAQLLVDGVLDVDQRRM